MIRKLTFATGFGAGYVLGAKAGRERYEQIVSQFQQLRNRATESTVDGTPMQTHGSIDLTRTTQTVNSAV